MPHILKLPTELLQLIADYNVDTTILRRVCKAFDAAFFDAFAEEYLSDIQCFLLDIERLERLNSIMSRRHLARSVKKVTLSMDPLEGKPSSEIPVALLPHFEDQFEIGQVLAKMCMLEAKYDPFMRHEPPVKAIASVLQTLRISGCPYIVLDCHLQTLGLSLDLRNTIETNATKVTLNILQTLCLSGCRLSAIRLNQTLFLDRFAEGRGHRNGLSQYSSSLQSLAYEADLDDTKRVFGNPAANAPPQISGEWGLVTILKGARDLQDLKLGGPFNPRRVRSMTAMAFASKCLSTCSVLRLRKVELSAMQCDPAAFWAALEGWKESLEDLTLDSISLDITTDLLRRDSWLKTFEILLRCEKLTKLRMDTLFARCSTGDASPSLDLKDVGWSEMDVFDKISVEGASAIREVLRLNLETGGTFSYKVRSRLIRDRNRDEFGA